MNKPLCIAWVMLCACTSSSPEPAQEENPFDSRTYIGPTVMKTRYDIDRHGGEWVKLVGRFEPVQFTHGLLTLDSGLAILIPDFDRFKAGDDWLKYSGKRVAVGGRLDSHFHRIAGHEEPALIIDFFEPMERIR